MFRLAGWGLGISGVLFVAVVGALLAADILPATGKIVFFTTPTRARGGKTYLVDVDREFRHYLFTLPLGVSRVALSPDGRWAAFVAERFDETTRLYTTDLSGRHAVNISGSWGYNDFPAWSPDSRRLAFIAAAEGDFPNLYAVNADGSGLQRLSDQPVSFQAPAWSPDGSRVAFVAGDIQVVDAASGSLRWRVNPLRGGYNNLAWSPDGRWLAFIAFDGFALGLYVLDADGGNLRRLTPDTLDVRRYTWSPDGRRLALAALQSDNADVYVADAACDFTLDGAAARGLRRCGLRRLTDHAGFDWLPAWAPDGAWIAFISYRERGAQLNLIQPDGSGLRRLIGQDVGDLQPVWLP